MEKHLEHNIYVYNRLQTVITGIRAVESFDENSITLSFDDDTVLCIEGNDLSIKEVNLEKGTVEAGGLVSGMFYYDRTIKKKSIFTSIFKKI